MSPTSHRHLGLVVALLFPVSTRGIRRTTPRVALGLAVIALAGCASGTTTSAKPAARGQFGALLSCLNDHGTWQVTVNHGSAAGGDAGDRYVNVISDTHGSIANLTLYPTRQQAAANAHVMIRAHRDGPLVYQWTPGTLTIDKADIRSCVEQGYGTASTTPSAATTPTGSSATTAASAASPTSLRACDPNITAGADTSCPFAENVFKAVGAGYQAASMIPSQVTAFSPATHKTYRLLCGSQAGTVLCSDVTGSVVEFSVASVEAYGPTTSTPSTAPSTSWTPPASTGSATTTSMPTTGGGGAGIGGTGTNGNGNGQ